MSKILVGIKEMALLTPWTEQTFRKYHLPDMVKARVVFRSKLPCVGNDGKKRRFWQYWSTENLITRYLMALADNNGKI